VLEAADVAVKSPAHGLPPTDFDRMVGQRLAVSVVADTPLRWELFETEEEAAEAASERLTERRV
jgi:sialic acid synthase SpsE